MCFAWRERVKNSKVCDEGIRRPLVILLGSLDGQGKRALYVMGKKDKNKGRGYREVVRDF